jgi:hypothetical protein
MDIAAIKEKAQLMGAGGIDARTITVDFEVTLGRALQADEAQAIVDGWRASAKDRHAKGRARDQRAADEAQGRVPRDLVPAAVIEASPLAMSEVARRLPPLTVDSVLGGRRRRPSRTRA